MCTPIDVHSSFRHTSWAFDGMVVRGKFRRATDPSCSYFMVADVHINNDCAKQRRCGAPWRFQQSCRRSSWWFRLPPHLVSPRPLSALPACFAAVQASYRCGASEPHGSMWPECCGFVMLPESQTQWRIMGNGSFDVSTFVLDLKSSKRSAPGTLPWLLIRTVLAVHKDKRCIRPLGNNLNQVSNASTQLTEYMMSPPDPLSCFRTSDRSGANCTRDCRGSVSSIYLRSQLGGRSKIRDTFVF